MLILVLHTMFPLRNETLSFYACLLQANHFVPFGAHERKHLIKCIHLVVVAFNKKEKRNPIGKPFKIALLLLFVADCYIGLQLHAITMNECAYNLHTHSTLP